PRSPTRNFAQTIQQGICRAILEQNAVHPANGCRSEIIILDGRRKKDDASGQSSALTMARMSRPFRPGIDISCNATSGRSLRITPMLSVPLEQLATIVKDRSEPIRLMRP